MAIEIIGKDSTIPKEAVCKNCATRLRYTLSDTIDDYSTDYTGRRDYYRFILCPCCGYNVTVPRN